MRARFTLTTCLVTTCLVTMLLAGMAFAESSVADSVLDAAALEGVAYVQARDAILADGAQNLETLEKLAAPDQWTASNWRQACVAAALCARIRSADLAQRADHLDGVNPEHYKLRRIAAPEVARELGHLGGADRKTDAVSLILELGVFLGEVYDYSEENRAIEQRALMQGLIASLDRHADPRGIQFVLSVLEVGETREARAAKAPVEDRVLALQALGSMTRALVISGDLDAAKTQQARLVDQAGSDEVRLRHAAAQGLARIPTQSALDALALIHATETDVEVRATVLTSVGMFASPWVWGAYGEAVAEQGESIRATASRMLARVYQQTTHEAERTAAHDAVLSAQHPAALEILDAGRPDEALLVESLKLKLRRTRR